MVVCITILKQHYHYILMDISNKYALVAFINHWSLLLHPPFLLIRIIINISKLKIVIRSFFRTEFLFENNIFG